jgi:hypothetical protein
MIALCQESKKYFRCRAKMFLRTALLLTWYFLR